MGVINPNWINPRISLLALLVLLCSIPSYYALDIWKPPNLYYQGRLNSDVPASYYAQGYDMSNDALVLVSGARGENSQMGKAYVYIRESTKDWWVQHQVLAPADLASYDMFGHGVKLSEDGQILAVSAIRQDTGSIYMFSKNSTSHFVQFDKLRVDGLLSTSLMGSPMTMTANGSAVLTCILPPPPIMGMPMNMDNRCFYFLRNATGLYNLEHILEKPAGTSFFGFKVALNPSGTHAIFAAGSSHVMVFLVSNWTIVFAFQETGFNPSDCDINDELTIVIGFQMGKNPSNVETGSVLIMPQLGSFNRTFLYGENVGERFGYAVALNNRGVLTVGIAYESTVISRGGAIAVYIPSQRDHTTATSWLLTTRARLPIPAQNDYLGRYINRVKADGWLALSVQSEYIQMFQLRCPAGYALYSGYDSCGVFEPHLTGLSVVGGPVSGNTTVVGSGTGFSLLNCSSNIAKAFLTDGSGTVALEGSFQRVSNGESDVHFYMPARDHVGNVSIQIGCQDIMNRTYATQDDIQFVYYNDLTQLMIHTHGGPVTGGTTVQVTSTQSLTASGVVRCRFGSMLVAPIELSLDSMVCITPSTTSVAHLPVAVSLNLQQWDVVVNQSFAYFSVNPIGLLPRYAPISGGTVVSFNATGLVPTDDIPLFRLSSGGMTTTEVNGTWDLSTNMPKFVLPDLSSYSVVLPHTINVEVTLNGQRHQFLSVSLPLVLYSASFDVSSVAPASAALDSAVNISLSGAGFLDIDDIVVKLEKSGQSPRLFRGRYETDTRLSATIDANGWPTGVSTISASLNGQQYSPTHLLYWYQVDSAYPPLGSAGGGSAVALSGDFPASGSFRCLFGSKAVSGTLSSGGSIECTAPAGTGIVHVEVSCNGQDDWTSSSRAMFKYFDIPIIQSISPNVTYEYGSGDIVITGGAFLNATTLEVVLVDTQNALLPIDMTHTQFVTSSTLLARVPNLESLQLALPKAFWVEVRLDGQQASQTSSKKKVSVIASGRRTVTGVSPATGPVCGGIGLTVSGTHMGTVQDPVTCRFASANPAIDVQVAGSVLDDSSVSCILPNVTLLATSIPTVVSLTVSLKNASYGFTTTNAEFRYYPTIVLTNIVPTSDAAEGGSTVALHGHFFNSSAARIKFVDVLTPSLVSIVSATVVSPTEVLCVAPNMQLFAPSGLTLTYPRNVHVYFVVDGQSLRKVGSGDTIFTYTEERTLSSVSPSGIPLAGGTRMVLTGTNLGFVGSSISVQITIPSCAPLIATANITDVDVAIFTVPTVPPTCSSGQGYVSVARLSGLGGYLEQNDSMAIDAYSVPVIAEITPKRTEPRGGVLIVIKGSGFLPLENLKCRFGNDSDPYKSVISATYLNSSAISCTAPSHPANHQLSVTVPIYVSGNGGADWHSPSSFALASLEYFPCQPGEYSSSYTEACTPCSAGRYSVLYGEGACLECPVGYYCNEGSSSASKCPAFTTSLKQSESLVDCQCITNYYHPDGLRGKECAPCPNGASCLGSISRPFPKAGYWNSRQQADYTFFTCPGLSTACLGGANVSSECALGYSGRMCSLCSPGHYRLAELCPECPPVSLWIMFVGAFAFMIFIYILMRFGGGAQSGGSLSVAVSYVQIAGLFGSFRLEWAEQVLAFLSSLSFFQISVDFVAPECSIRGWSYLDRFALTMCLPLISTGIAFMWHGITVLHHKMVHGRCGTASVFGRFSGLTAPVPANAGRIRRPFSRLRYLIGKFLTQSQDPVSSLNGAINATLMMLSILYVILSVKALEVFDCTPLHGGKYSLDALPEMDCWVAGGQHAKLVPWAGIFTVLYVIGIPVLFITILLKNKKKAQDPQETVCRRTFGSLFARFAPEWYFWEIIVMSRKLLMVMIKLYLTRYPMLQGALGEMVLMVALSLHMHSQPYAKPALNRLETGLLFVNFITLLVGVMFYADRWTPPAMEQWVETGTIIMISISIMLVIVTFIAETRYTWRMIRAKRGGHKVYQDSVAWKYWSAHLPTSMMKLLREYMDRALDFDLKVLDKVTKEVQEASTTRAGNDANRALASLFKGHKSDFANFSEIVVAMILAHEDTRAVRRVIGFLLALEAKKKVVPGAWQLERIRGSRAVLPGFKTAEEDDDYRGSDSTLLTSDSDKTPRVPRLSSVVTVPESDEVEEIGK